MDPLREGVLMMCGATVGAFFGLLGGGILDWLVDPSFGSNLQRYGMMAGMGFGMMVGLVIAIRRRPGDAP